jgi:hypothetical protein
LAATVHMLAGSASATSTSGEPVLEHAHPDARLLEFCAKAQAIQNEYGTLDRFPEEKWGQIQDDITERLRAAQQAIVLTPTRTMAGLRAKARAIIDTCWSGDLDFDDAIIAETTDRMIAASILRDLAGFSHYPEKHGRPQYSEAALGLGTA